MDNNTRDTFRKSRLAEFVAVKYGGNKAACGRALGYRDGALLGQMLNGVRPITEKTIEKIHSLPGGEGWFDVNQKSAPVPAWTEPAGHSSFGLALAMLYDALPNDQFVRAKAWNDASMALMSQMPEQQALRLADTPSSSVTVKKVPA